MTSLNARLLADVLTRYHRKLDRESAEMKGGSMLFTIQSYTEDYLNNLNIKDTDGYATQLAMLYWKERAGLDLDRFLDKSRKHIKTIIFINNSVKRVELERLIVDRLDKKFLKQMVTPA